jgi:hypothetical protein
MNPSPVADPRAPYNHWGLLASDPRVTRLLGRPATMANRGWSVPEAIPDQVAVGLTNVGDHADAVNNRLPQSIRARDPQSSWFWNLGFMGWSAGDGRAVSHLSRYANVPAVVAAPENRRLGEVLRAAATEALAPGFYAGTPKSHANRFYTLSRALQKRRVGQDLCAETGFDPAWFGLGLPNEDALVDVIVRAGYGAPLAGQTLPAGDVRPAFDVGAIALDRRADLAADYASNTSREPPGVIARLRHFFFNY